MNTKFKVSSFFTILLLSLLLVLGSNSLSNILQSSNAAPSNQLVVSAAASLKNVLEEIQPLYQQQHPETEIIYNFASSGSLQRQIEQGAPVDVFISAASSKMDALEEQNLLLTETRRDLLQNQMVLISSNQNYKNNIQLENFEDLTTQEITTIALGEPNSVPAGKYAQEVLNSLKIADKVNSKAVYGKDVRQIVNYVATGNADAGIVYRTDAVTSDRVQIITTAPKNTHSPVIYPIGVIKDSDNPEASKELIDFLTTTDVQKVFAEYGFLSVNSYQS